MIRKMEHLGLAVQDLEAATDLFARLLGQQPYKTEAVASEGVTTVFFQVGDFKIELLGATSPDSPVARFLEKRGEGIHHVAFQVDDIEGETRRLQEDGFIFSGTTRPGADAMQVNFLHPKGTHGTLIELCQPQTTDHD